MRLAVVLPLLNEAEYLNTLLADLTRELDSLEADWRILFVNDGSTDASPRLLDEFAAKESRVGVLHLSRNFGHAAAVQAGLDHVADSDAIVLMDSDGQDDPKAIRKFVEAWQRGAAVVYAVRFNRKEVFWKRILFSGFYEVLTRCSQIPIPKDAGNFGLIDGVVARHICRLPESDRYFPGLRSWVGYKQESIAVERLERHDRYPRVSMRGLIALAKNALFGFSRVPLAVFYWLAAASATVSFVFVSYAIYHRFFTGLAVPGWASMTSVCSFFGAINSLGIAILGEYVARIYDQVRGRPNYLVARSANAFDQDPYSMGMDGRSSSSLKTEKTLEPEEILLKELKSIQAPSTNSHEMVGENVQSHI